MTALSVRWCDGFGVMLLTLSIASSCPAFAQDAASLKAMHAQLHDQLANNAFQRPLVLESNQSSGDLRGDVYAVIDQPFTLVESALQSANHWCDLLMLHLNVKGCATSGKASAQTLSLVVGRKFDQPLDDGYKVDFSYVVSNATADYLRVQMASDEGPIGTKNYHLALEAVPLDGKSSFVHMSYAYGYGLAARLALQTYLATAGASKIGFSITGKSSDGQPVYINGMRGVMERNTMRYYLAIEAYLGALAAPAAEQNEKRLRDWFNATERFAPQLHEMDRGDYLSMKRKEVQRQHETSKTPQ